jgi:dTDP-L-rhamnose 4-epimerase
MEQLNILVTGGAGFIGSHLVDALVNLGHSVRVLDSLVPQVHPIGRSRFLNTEADFVLGDVCDAEVVDNALREIDVVFHQAAEVGVGQSMYEVRRYVRANTLGTATLLEKIVARRGQIRKLIVASSMSIYGEGAYHCGTCGTVSPKLRRNQQLSAHRWELECDTCTASLKPVRTNEDKPLFPTSVYAVTKQDQEQLCLILGRAYNIPTVALRYFNVYGTRQTLSNPYTGVCAIFAARLLNNNGPVIYEDGEQTRDFTHVSDIVQANLLALDTSEADYTAVNIGTGVPTPVRRLAEMLSKGLGKEAMIPELTGRYREGDIRHCVAEISRARTLLGYEPRVALEDAMSELLEWVKQESAVDHVHEANAELENRQLVR